jgi:hypothetical protein
MRRGRPPVETSKVKLASAPKSIERAQVAVEAPAQGRYPWGYFGQLPLHPGQALAQGVFLARQFFGFGLGSHDLDIRAVKLLLAGGAAHQGTGDYNPCGLAATHGVDPGGGLPSTPTCVRTSATRLKDQDYVLVDTFGSTSLKF